MTYLRLDVREKGIRMSDVGGSKLRDRVAKAVKDDERKKEETERNWGFIIILVGQAATDGESQLTRRVKVNFGGAVLFQMVALGNTRTRLMLR